MDNIVAVIVAGGKGTRLRPLTEHLPKPMVLVGGVPLLLHTINLFKKNGITSFVVALAYLPKAIVDYFGDGSRFGVKITYTFEDPNTPRGTAGAIHDSAQYIDATFIVTYADILRDLDIKKMLEAHTLSQSFATLNVYPHKGGNYKSNLIFDERNNLTQFIELPTSTTLPPGDTCWSNGSFYIFEPEIFSYIPKDRPSDFARDIFPLLLREGEKVSVFPTEGYFIDVGTIENLQQVEKDLQKDPSSSAT